MKTRLGLFACLTLPLALSLPLAAQSPNPNQPYIQSISYGGTGCPNGTVGSSFSNDRTSFTLIFDSFVASSGPGVPVTEGRKNCQLNLNVRVPNGSGQYCAVLDYRGYVQLPSGTTADSSAIYYTQDYTLPDGQLITIGGSPANFAGPVARDYLTRDSVDLSWNGAEPAINPVNINSQVRLIGPASAQAQITHDSIDGRLTPGACDGGDTEPPTITITNPVSGGLYGLGTTVAPAFTCADSGSGVASCTGAPAIDTTAIGAHTFTVTAVDNAGNTSTASIDYAVGGKNECKGGGHSKFLAPTFRNQGLCVSSFVK